MYLVYVHHVKDQGRTKEGIIVRALGRDKNQGTTKELPTTKKCFLLRLASLSSFLYLSPMARLRASYSLTEASDTRYPIAPLAHEFVSEWGEEILLSTKKQGILWGSPKKQKCSLICLICSIDLSYNCSGKLFAVITHDSLYYIYTRRYTNGSAIVL